MSSADKTQAQSLRARVLGEISQLPKADRAAVHAVADKIRAAIAEGNVQGDDLGDLALALIGAELQEAAS